MFTPFVHRYIGEEEQLKAAMNLLRDPSASIQLEAFHVFKIFAANPKKDGKVLHVLQARARPPSPTCATPTPHPARTRTTVAP